MKITVQDKVAELESRIAALENVVRRMAAAPTVTRTTTVTSDTHVMTEKEKSALDRIWAHFHSAFDEFGKAFREI